MKEFDNSTLVKNLINYREKSNKKQKDISIEIGINPKTYSVYERGVQPPSINTLEKLAKFHNITVDHLLGTIKENSQSNEILLEELEALILNLTEDNKIRFQKIAEYIIDNYS